MYNQYNNPYYPNFRPMESQYNQMQQNPISMPKAGLQGELVETIEMAKNTRTNMDGSISYLPLVDGSAIVTKQLGTDGISKTVVYRPVQEEKEKSKYVTPEELEKITNDIEEELKEIRKQLKDRESEQ